MKITGVVTAIAPLGFRNAVLTRVDTDEGISGVSEVVLKRRSHTVARAIEEAARALLGQDPRRIERIYEQLYRDSFWVGGPLHATPLAAIELALWDLAGKRLGAPVYELLGGPTRDLVAVYGHCPAGGSPEAFADALEACCRGGHHTLKTTLPLFYGSPDSDWLRRAVPHGYSGAPGALERTLAETERLPTWVFDAIASYFAAARERVGNGVDIAVDCHGRLSVANAKRLCDALEPFRLLFIEEPVPPENVDAVAEVTRASTTPIAAGERVATLYGARPFLEQAAVSLWQPDICNCGGLAQARRIAALAEAHYIGIAPHNPNGPLATAQSVHLAATIPNFTILETIGSAADQALGCQLVVDPLPMADGHLPLPTSPGWGVELREEVWALGHAACPFEGWR